MKKLISLVALLTVIAHGSPVLAIDSYSVVGQPNRGFEIPVSKNGVADDSRKWSQPSICRVEASLTCVQCLAAGAGLLVDLEVDSGAAGGFARVFDTITLTGEVATVPLAGTSIAMQQTCPGAPASTAGAACGSRQFPDGRPFTGGLVLCTSAADVFAIATYRVLRK